ncbi:MAG TPA: aldehyde dehydrogenase family protein, partial [Thermoanaerobaculia bacterium]|nr:aldehyde dehydrogenase family protein [Thermoanaerobaculia bacterium]
LGVVALVTPWNNPIAVPLGKLAPALALGNAVVWKPAPAGAARALSVARWLAEAGLPPGVLTVVCGGRATAELLLSHPGVDAITLTGGEAAGVTAGAIALSRGVPLQAELGGNNGAIVWGDADLPAAAAAIAEGAFGFAGQRCTATRRAIVDRSCLPSFLERLEAAVAALPWGDPLAEETVVGPLPSAASLRRVEGVVERARGDGCEVLTPHLAAAGGAPSGGFYHPPVLVLAEDPAAEVVQEETFGPVLVVQPAAGWEEALELLDGVRQGLAAALFSPSPERRRSFLRRARAGVLKLDAATAGVDAALPFGGWKRSGIGPPEHGEGDLLAFTRAQAIYGAGGG